MKQTDKQRSTVHGEVHHSIGSLDDRLCTEAREDARPPKKVPARDGEGERPREPSFGDDDGANVAVSRPTLPVRHRPASGVFVSSLGPTIVFVTVCTSDRQPWLAQPVAHDALQLVWRAAHAWLIGRYLLMPDHMHFFCAPKDETVPLKRWLTYWKRLFTQETRNAEWKWQSNAWDTRLRRGENYTEKWQYVAMNPVRKKLVERPEEWPYQGVLNELRW